MALVIADRVKETTTTTGTGAVTLAGAAMGYQAFSAAVSDGNTTYYCISDQGGANWEVGLGTYAAAGNTLARITVLSSSNAGALVNFASGTKDVFLTCPAGKSVLQDANGNVKISGSLNTVNSFGYKNKFINATFELARRGTSFSAISSAYLLERWRVDTGTTLGRLSATQSTNTPNGTPFPFSLKLGVTTADTVVDADDIVVLRQYIEGYNIKDFINNTFTLQFWVNSAKSGTHCIAFRNSSGATKSYVVEYNVSAANTWEFKTVTVVGGIPSAAVLNTTNGIGLEVSWPLMCGSTRQTTANTWNSGDYFATSNQVNLMVSTSNTFSICGPQIEVGSIPTTFDFRNYGIELVMANRFFELLDFGGSAGSNYAVAIQATKYSASDSVQVHLPFSTKRNYPTISAKNSIRFVNNLSFGYAVPTFLAGNLNGASLTWTNNSVGQGAVGWLDTIGLVYIDAEL